VSYEVTKSIHGLFDFGYERKNAIDKQEKL